MPDYELKMPEPGFSVVEGTVVEWSKSVGEEVHEGETVVTVETDKISVEIPASVDGYLKQISYNAGETVAVGAVLGTIVKEAVSPESRSGVMVSDRVDRAREHPKGVKKMTPAARAIARKEGIDLSEITSGSGPEGRIVKEDIAALVERKELNDGKKGSDNRVHASIPGPEKVEFTGWRKILVDRMTASNSNIPHAYMSVMIDVTNLADVIKSYKEKNMHPKLTYVSFFVKAVVAGIELIPEVNAYCFDDGYTIKSDVNVGIAVDLDDKLIVPVLCDIQNKTIIELAEELSRLIERARTNSLLPEDISEGTITITNIGVFGIHSAAPIILPPQTAIVAMGAVEEVPTVVQGSIEIRKEMCITAGFDHRVVNGGPGARFLGAVKRYLEDVKTNCL